MCDLPAAVSDWKQCNSRREEVLGHVHDEGPFVLWEHQAVIRMQVAIPTRDGVTEELISCGVRLEGVIRRAKSREVRVNIHPIASGDGQLVGYLSATNGTTPIHTKPQLYCT